MPAEPEERADQTGVVSIPPCELETVYSAAAIESGRSGRACRARRASWDGPARRLGCTAGAWAVTGAEAVIRALAGRGVTTVFGIPGVDNLAFFEALDRSALRSVLVRHEATAGYAADAFFRVSGRPAVCFTTAGPGAANAVTPMGEAWASMSGFVHLTTTVATAYATPARPRSLPHYHPRQIAMAQPVAKLALHCDDPAQLAEGITRCVDASLEPPPGPTYLEVPFDLLAADVNAEPQASADGFGHSRRALDDDARARIGEAARLLASWRQPVVWAGSGSLGAADALLAVAERLDAPVLLTHSARRRFGRPEHPLLVTYPPHEPAVADMLEAADGILVVGSDLDAMMTRQFGVRLPASLVHIDVERAHIGMNYAAVMPIAAAAESALPALLQAMAEWRGTANGIGRAAAARDRTRAELTGDGRGPLPRRYLEALDRTVPGDAIVVCDMAVAAYWAAGYLPLRQARQILYPIGWGTLGFGLPAAIGAAVAAPGRRVVCIVGDAGCLYAAGELATIAEHRLPITVVVVDDAGYGMLRYAGERRFGRTFAVNLQSPDFARLAEAFRLPAWSGVLDGVQLEALLSAALAEDGPSLVALAGTLVPPRMSILTAPPPPG